MKYSFEPSLTSFDEDASAGVGFEIVSTNHTHEFTDEFVISISERKSKDFESKKEHKTVNVYFNRNQARGLMYAIKSLLESKNCQEDA